MEVGRLVHGSGLVRHTCVANQKPTFPGYVENDQI